MAIQVNVVSVRLSADVPGSPLLCLSVQDESCSLLSHACMICHQRMPVFSLQASEDHSAALVSCLRERSLDEKHCRLMTATHSSGASLQAVGIHPNSLPREQAALLAIAVAAQALTAAGLSDDPCQTGLFPQLLQLAQLGYRHAGVQITGQPQSQSGQPSSGGPARSLPAPSENESAPTKEFKEGHLRIAVRGDSLLATRSDSAKKKSYRTFKAEFQDHFWKAFGATQLDYNPRNGESVKGVTRGIEMGTYFDIMCVGIGINDLMEPGDRNIVKASYPGSLDADLRELGKAIKGKCKISLVVVGGPASVWKYPARWDTFVDRAHGVLEDTGVTLVPIQDVADVMKQMKLSFDEMHFAHDDDDNRAFFAQAWTSWLQYYAGVRKVANGQQNSGRQEHGQKRLHEHFDGQGSRRRA